VFNILKNLQSKKVSKSPMMKMLKKVDVKPIKEGTNQMSASDGENAKNHGACAW